MSNTSIKIVILLLLITISLQETFSQYSWKKFGDLNQGRWYFCALPINHDEIIVIGGYGNSGAPLSSCEIINNRTGQISTTNSMSTPRAEFVSLLTPDSNVIVVSGLSSSNTTTTSVELFNRSTRQWSTLGNLLVGRRQHAAIMLDSINVLVFTGRLSNLSSISDAEIFNINTGNSTKVADYPHALNTTIATRFSNGDIIGLAGREGGQDSPRPNQVYRYNRTSNTWTQVTSIIEGSNGISYMNLWNGRSIVGGGGKTETNFQNMTWVMRETNGNLSKLCDMAVPRRWYGTAQWNTDSIMTVGGYDNSFSYTRSMDWIDLRTGNTGIGPPTIDLHTWHCLISMPVEYNITTPTRGKVFCISGLTSGATTTRMVEVLAPDKLNQSTCSNLDTLELVNNGNFNSGVSGFTTDYAVVSQNTTVQQCTVSNNVRAFNPGWSQCGDHTTGNGNLFIINGADTPNRTVWRQTVSVEPFRNYKVSLWATTLFPDNPPRLRFFFNNTPDATTLKLTSQTCDWQEYSTFWQAPPGVTSLTLRIEEIERGFFGNDFAIDDISMKECKCSVTVNVRVNRNIICRGDTTLIDAGRGFAGYRWSTGARTQTIVVRDSDRYWVEVTDSSGCVGRDTVVVTSREFRIDAQKDTSVCSGADSLTIRVRGLNGVISSVRWSPSIFVACDTCPTTKIQPPTATTRFIATATDSTGCIGRDTVTITILPPTAVDAGPDQEYCNPNDSLTLRVSGRNIRSVRWSPSVGLACDTCITTKVKPSAITYRVAVRFASGCDGNDSVTIRPRTRAIPSGNNGNQSICFKNDSAQLMVTGNFRTIKWTPSTALSCDTCRSTFSSTKETITYYYTLTDASGCELRDSLKVSVFPPAQLFAEPDTIICASTAVLIRANGSFQTINWTPPIGLSCSSCNVTLATPPKRDITYYAVAINGNSKDCEVIDSVQIKYARGIEDQIPSRDTICLGDSVRLSINFGGSLRWTPPSGMSCDTCKQVILKPTGRTRYVVQGDSLGCLSRDTIDIMVVPAVTVSATADTSICEGKSVELRANTNSSQVSWAPAKGLSCTNCPNPTASPLTSTQYIVTVGNGACTKKDTVNIIVKPRLLVGVTPIDTTICSGEDVQFNLIPTPPPTSVITWSPSTYLSSTNIANPRAIGVKQSIQYSVRVQGENGCDTVITPSITIQPSLTFSVVNEDTTMCEGSSVRVRMTGDTSAQFIWTPIDGLSCSNCPTPTITADSSRRYIVRTQSSGNCQKSDTLNITVMPKPSIMVSVLPKDTVCLNDNTARLLVSGGGAEATYSWIPSTGLSSPIVANPQFTLTAVAGTYNYSVTVTSREGCSSTIQKSITVEPCSLSITLTADPNVQTSFLSCDSLTSTITIRNIGDAVTTIDSVSLVGGFQQGAILDPMLLQQINAQLFPMTIQPNSSRVVPIRIIPTNTGGYTIDVVAFTGGKTQLLRIVGQTHRRDIRLKLFGAVSEFNKNFILPLYAESQYWNELKVNDILLTIFYDQTRMEYLGDTTVKISTSLQNSWSAKEVPGSFQLGKINVSLRSLLPSTILTKDDTLMHIGFRPLLTDSRNTTTQPTIQYILPNKQIDCSNNLTQIFPVSYVLCAADIRSIVLSTYPFGLTSAVPNPTHSTLTIHYTIGFDSFTELKLYDINGQTISTIYNGIHKAGEYEASVDVSTLAQGVYFCSMTSAGSTVTQQIRIVR